MEGFPIAVIGRWSGYRKGFVTPSQGVNAGKSLEWVQISLSIDSPNGTRQFWVSTDTAHINHSNIEKEDKAYFGEKVKITGVLVVRNYQGKQVLKIYAQLLELAK